MNSFKVIILMSALLALTTGCPQRAGNKSASGAMACAARCMEISAQAMKLAKQGKSSESMQKSAEAMKCNAACAKK